MYGLGNYIGWPICGKGMGLAAYQPRIAGYGWPRRGLGCGCGCGGRCQQGLGYFDTGWDISGWGAAEWGTVLVFAYMVISTFTTTQRGYRRARRSYKRMRQRIAA